MPTVRGRISTCSASPADEHAAIDALDGPTRAGHDPLTFTYA